MITFTAAYTGAVRDRRPRLPRLGPHRHLPCRHRPARTRSTNPTRSRSATPITIGTEYYGFIDSAATGPYGPGFGEVDTFSINAVAGKVYTIEIAGGADYASNYLALPPGEIDSVIVVYGPDQSTVIAVNDDINFGNGDIGSGVGFLAEKSGTYYSRRLLLPAVDRRLFDHHLGARPGGLQSARRDQLVQRRQYRHPARRHREGLFRRTRGELRRARRQ